METPQPAVLIARLEGIRLNRWIWNIFIVACLAQLFDGVDLMMTGFALPGIVKEFKLTSPIFGGIIFASTFAGMLIGSLVFSTLSDKVGRKPAFAYTILIYALGTFLSGLAPDYYSLLAARVFTGFGLGGELPIANTIAAEFCPARYRGKLLPTVASFMNLGWPVAALLGIFIVPAFGWRALYFVGIAPAIISFVIRRYMPESVRILIRKGDLEGAAKVLDHIRAPPSSEVVVRAESVDVSSKPRFSELFSKEYRRRTIVLCCVMFFSMFSNMGFAQWLPSVLMGPPYNLPAALSFTYSLISNIGSPVGAFSTILVVDWLGRKRTGMIYGVLAAVCFLVFGTLTTANLPLFLLFAFLTPAMFTGCVIAGVMWGVELYPTRMRNMGEGFAQAWGRVGMIFGPLTGGVVLAFFTDKYWLFVLFAICDLLAGISFSFGIETRKKVLEHISK
jgi:putative MFS transporter